MSVRIRSSLVIILLIAILVAALFVGVRGSRVAAEDAREINGVGLIRTRASQTENVARQLVSIDTANQATLRALTDKVTATAAINESLVGLYAASESVAREEFAAFVQEALAANPELLGIAFVPRIVKSERVAFEQSVQAEGFETFQIRELTAEGESIAAGERDVYYPVLYAEPFIINSFAFGVDFAVSAPLVVAMDAARDSGETVLSSPTEFALPGSTQQIALLVIFTPIYQHGATTETMDDRRRNLLGFSIAALNIDALVNSALSGLPQANPVIQINDTTDSETSGILSIYTNRQFAEVTDISTLTLSTQVYGRTWEFSLQQPIDPAAVLQQLQATTADLQNRVDKLRDGDEDLGFYGLDRYSNTRILTAYESLLATTATLVSDVENFANSSSRSTDLAAIETSTASLTQKTDAIVDLLESESEARVDSTTRTSLLVGGIAALISLFGFVTIFQITTTLARVNRSASQLSHGNLQTRIPVQGRYELAQIGQSINEMAAQLQESFSTLEQRVAESTSDLQTVIDLNKQVSIILSVEPLLRAVTSLTKDRFGLYHAHIFLLNQAESSLDLAAGAGYVGRQMVSRGHHIPYESPRSLVAKAARSQQSVVVNSTAEASDHLPNPLLPDTRAELAIPLISRGELLGVFDVQSDQRGFFTPRLISVLELLASQVGNALANAQLYEAAANAGRHEQALSHITQSIQEANSVDEVLQTAVRELGKALRVPYTAIELQLGSSEDKSQPPNN